ncbi:MAG: hypothetical protein EXR79_10495 [Myxococcales bacterium]|nr:hypothetical protein [Myxococcales bacterium]
MTGAVHVTGPARSLQRIAAVAANTLREARRNRVFYGMLAAAVLLLLFSVALSELALADQKARLVQDFGLFSISLLTVATAVLMGALLLHKELERKTLYAILPKPIRRSEFLVGKFAGLCALLGVQVGLLGACWWGVLVLRGGAMTPALALALGLQYVEVVLVTAVALFFSALTRPVLAGVLTAGVFVVGRVVYVLQDLLSAPKGGFAEVPVMRALGKVLVAVLPDLSTFNVADEVLLGWPVPTDYVVAALGYGLSWTVLFVALALVLFERRDLT